jgi:Tol biopolymer transport system component
VPSWSRDGKWIYYSSYTDGEVWKITTDGDSAEQITFNGGGYALESFDGKWVYYNKSGRIWKKPAQGGKEKLVIDHPIGGRKWALVDKGIYYVNSTGVYDRVEFFSFKTENVTEIFDIGKKIAWGPICVSPDRHWLLYPHVDRFESNIMLKENFR